MRLADPKFGPLQFSLDIMSAMALVRRFPTPRGENTYRRTSRVGATADLSSSPFSSVMVVANLLPSSAISLPKLKNEKKGLAPESQVSNRHPSDQIVQGFIGHQQRRITGHTAKGSVGLTSAAEVEKLSYSENPLS